MTSEFGLVFIYYIEGTTPTNKIIMKKLEEVYASMTRSCSPRVLPTLPVLGEDWTQTESSHKFSAVKGGDTFHVVECYKFGEVDADRVWRVGNTGFVALNLRTYTDRFGNEKNSDGDVTVGGREVL